MQMRKRNSRWPNIDILVEPDKKKIVPASPAKRQSPNTLAPRVIAIPKK
jgi:hypothetical protein